ncbi:hypothetical protein CI957_827, partial [Methanohalophilus sp. WG1-DM]
RESDRIVISCLHEYEGDLFSHTRSVRELMNIASGI